MIAQVVAPASVGGLESVVAQLLCAAHDGGEPMALIALIDRDAPLPVAFDALRGHGVRIVRLDAPHRKYYRQYRSLHEAMRALGATIAHTHGAHADVLGGIVARALGLPHVATLHGFIAGGLKSRVFEWLQLRQLRSASAVIAVSAGVADHARRGGIPPECLRTIPNAAPEFSLKDRAVARARLTLPESGPVVGWVGRVSHEKGPEDFVRVLEATATGSGIVGVMMGDGPSMPAVRKQGAKLLASGRLMLAGTIADARQWLSALDVLALTSVTEGTPMIVLEAMRAGVPVVSTRVGGVPALLADGAGVLVEHGHWPEFAREIERLVSDRSASAAIVERAHRRVLEDYGVVHWWARHEELYHRQLAL